MLDNRYKGHKNTQWTHLLLNGVQEVYGLYLDY